MPKEPDNIVLVFLRRLDEKVDRVIEDFQDLGSRVTGVEEGTAGVHRRMDRFEARLDRLEKRFVLTDAAR